MGGTVDPKTGEIIWEMHVPLADQLAHYRANPPRIKLVWNPGQRTGPPWCQTAMQTHGIVSICVAAATVVSWAMSSDAVACPVRDEPDRGPDLLQVFGPPLTVLLAVALIGILRWLAYRRPTIVP